MSKNLLVSLVGMAHSDHLHNCQRLYIPVIDHGGRLRAFVQEIRSRFISAGLMVLTHGDRLKCVNMHFMILGNKSFKSTTVKTKPSVRQKLRENQVQNRLAGFDVRSLYEDYQTFPWTSSFALERLSLSTLDLADMVKDNHIIGRGFEEIASVPLPGIDYLEKQEEPEGVTYVRPEIIFV